MGKSEEHTMKGCDEYGTTAYLYFDCELSDQDLKAFRAHLFTCAPCLREFEAAEKLSALLRRSRPLCSASESLRADIMKAVDAWPSFTPGMRLYNWISLAAAILLVVGSLLVPVIRRQSNAASYIETAIAAHRSFLSGSLPLEVQSGSPNVITAWFAGKVPFTFRLPTSAENPEHQPVYRLTGGRLVNYRGGYAALVAYQMQQQRISLLVASSNSAVAAGGEQVAARGVVFHYSKHASLNIITWSTHGLTYALVSSLRGSGRESCMVCHQDMPDGPRASTR
jgi:anti-sigma factor (TIGR02949 family)